MDKQHHAQAASRYNRMHVPDTLITSKNNSSIKQIRALLKRSDREQTGLALVEGLRQVTEAFQHPHLVNQLIIAPELMRSQHGQGLWREQAQRGIPTLFVSTEAFQSFSLREGPQGIAAIITQRWEHLQQLRLVEGDVWVALEAIQDPGNLGTILRSCDAAGCRGIILLDNTTDPYDPIAVRASLGAVFTQRLTKTSFQAFAQWKQDYAYPVIGTSDAASSHYKKTRYPTPLIILMGSERQGLSLAQQKQCDLMVNIPMHGRCDSLNVAIATSIVLYEIFDQQA